MTLTKKDLAILDKFNFATQPVGVKFSVKRPDAVERLGNTGLPLGILNDETWDEAAVQMAPGDLLALYSDGLPEAQNPAQAFFGEERLLDALRRNRDRPATDVQEAVLAEVRAFVGDAPQFDDLTWMILARNPS